MRRSSRRPLENAVRMPPVRYVERLPRPAHPSKLFNPIERPSTISGRTVTRAAVSLRVSSPLITIGALSTGPSGRRLSSIRGVWTKVAMEQIEALLRERSLRRGLRSGPVIRSCERSERLAKDGGEGGIRTLSARLDSVSYRFCNATIAVNAVVAEAPCTRLHHGSPREANPTVVRRAGCER